MEINGEDKLQPKRVTAKKKMNRELCGGPNPMLPPADIENGIISRAES